MIWSLRGVELIPWLYHQANQEGQMKFSLERTLPYSSNYHFLGIDIMICSNWQLVLQKFNERFSLFKTQHFKPNQAICCELWINKPQGHIHTLRVNEVTYRVLIKKNSSPFHTIVIEGPRSSFLLGSSSPERQGIFAF